MARRGARYGMLAPMLVQFEQEIDELEQKIKRAEGRRNSQGSVTDVGTAHSDTDSDRASLDEWVSFQVFGLRWEHILCFLLVNLGFIVCIVSTASL